MATYITLMNFTEQGAHTIKDTVKRYEAAQKAAKEFGVTFKSMHWTQGAYDAICELEGKDELSLNAFALAMLSLGNLRMQTLRAFSADEMRATIAKMP